MTVPLSLLPQLDGTRAASNARIEAWLDEGRVDRVDDALHTARCEVDELHQLASAHAGKGPDLAEMLDKQHELVHEALDVIGNAVGEGIEPESGAA